MGALRWERLLAVVQAPPPDPLPVGRARLAWSVEERTWGTFGGKAEGEAGQSDIFFTGK